MFNVSPPKDIMALLKPTVYVASIYEGLSRIVSRLLPTVTIHNIELNDQGALSPNDRNTIIQNAEILFADLPFISDVMYDGCKLKWTQSTWAGVDLIIKNVDKEQPPNLLLTRTGRGFGKLMAEYVLGHIIAAERQFYNMYRDQTKKNWNPAPYNSFRVLSDVRLGILGAGQIGSEIGGLCKAVGMEVWGLSRTQKPQSENNASFDCHRTIEQLEEVLQNCDYVCSVLPNTLETTNLLSGKMLSHCQSKNSFFINVGRGNVIDEESLIQAISNGWIRGAVLDVFNTEPLPERSKLWATPNVIITPHISGPSLAEEIAKTFAANYNKYINNEPLDYTVDWNCGY